MVRCFMRKQPITRTGRIGLTSRMTPTQRYTALVASLHALAARKGYKVKPSRPGRFAIYDVETGERQTNNVVLGDPSYFSLERARQWLQCQRDR
jgi:hypothetical protein